MQRKIKNVYNLILKLTFMTFVFGFFIFMPSKTFAQIVSTDITLNIIPNNPEPKEDVIATITSFSVDLNKAFISWSIDGKEIGNGIGKKSITFQMYDLGSLLSLDVSIDTFDGQNVSKKLTITPTLVDMLWEATDSFVPPFYRGKTLVAPEGSFKVVAIPSINGVDGKINPNNLSYNWEQDGSMRPSLSGWGKDSLTFKNSYLEKENEIKVEVADITGKIKSEGKITLQTYTPRILFYKKDPFLGIQMNKSITSGYVVNKEGETLLAVPYFFSPKNLESPLLSFSWYLGGEKINTPKIKNEVNIRPQEGKSGSSNVRLFISNTKTLFQEAEKEVLVNF